MAICAMVAAADGNVDSDERGKTAKLIMKNDMLEVFDSSDLKTRFDELCDGLNDDFDFGKVACIQKIGRLKGNDEQARAAIQIGCIIGHADGSFDDDEKKVVREACHAVGIDPAEFDVA